MLFHISTDRIIFISEGQRIILPYGELEKNLPEFLYLHLSANADLADSSARITVINGPGSFTNLRIATLALNTYNMLHDFCLDFVSISKIERYLKVASSQQSVARYCIMYIGQKKNFWVVDLESITNYELRVMSGLKEGIVKLHIDNLKEYVATLDGEWFMDEMVAEGKEMMDSIFGKGGYNMYEFSTQHLVASSEGSVKMLEPNYMIEANVEQP